MRLLQNGRFCPTKGAFVCYQQGGVLLLNGRQGLTKLVEFASISYQAGDVSSKWLTEGLILRNRVFPFCFLGAVSYQMGGAPELDKIPVHY